MAVNWIDFLPAMVVAGTGIATIAVLKYQAAEAKTRHEQLHAGQTRIWQSVDNLSGDARENRAKFDAFYALEEERHENIEVAMDEVKGSLSRQNKEIHNMAVWQAGATEKMRAIPRAAAQHSGANPSWEREDGAS